MELINLISTEEKEDVLQELKDIKELLRIIASNTEQKNVSVNLNVGNLETKSPRSTDGFGY